MMVGWQSSNTVLKSTQTVIKTSSVKQAEQSKTQTFSTYSHDAQRSLGGSDWVSKSHQEQVQTRSIKSGQDPARSESIRQVQTSLSKPEQDGTRTNTLEQIETKRSGPDGTESDVSRQVKTSLDKSDPASNRLRLDDEVAKSAERLKTKIRSTMSQDFDDPTDRDDEFEIMADKIHSILTRRNPVQTGPKLVGEASSAASKPVEKGDETSSEEEEEDDSVSANGEKCRKQYVLGIVLRGWDSYCRDKLTKSTVYQHLIRKTESHCPAM